MIDLLVLLELEMLENGEETEICVSSLMEIERC